jgi:hypothetical protein
MAAIKPDIWFNCAGGLRGRKYTYCESATAVHFSDLYRCVDPLCASKDRKNVLATDISTAQTPSEIHTSETT